MSRVASNQTGMGWAITWAPIPFSHDENDLRWMGLMAAVGRFAKAIEAPNVANRNHLRTYEYSFPFRKYPLGMVAKLRFSICKIICSVTCFVAVNVAIIVHLVCLASHSLEINFILAAFLVTGEV